MRPVTKGKVYFSNISVKKIIPSPLNPRKIFDSDGIHELAQSFLEYGIIQPIIVYRKKKKYIIICGERRWRASKIAEFSKIPAVIHPHSPKDEVAVSMALIENMHRQDVDLVNESSAIRTLIENYNWSREKIAHELGVSTAYIRNRLLLTEYNDVLDAYNKSTISFSEAVALASIKDTPSRTDFTKRLQSKEFGGFAVFSETIARHKQVKRIIDAGYFLKQPLLKEKIVFSVPGLPYCDHHCKSYFRQTWEERKRFGIAGGKPGWAEYCTEKGGNCYFVKVKARKDYLKSLVKVKSKNPIPHDGWESMLWFKYRRKLCRNCEYVVDAADFDAIGQASKPGIYAYCIAPKNNCYNTKCNAYKKMGEKRDKLKVKSEKIRKNQLLKEISKKASFGKSPNSYITKAECAYLVLQFVCYIGGKERLESFVKKTFRKNNMPTKFKSQVTYVKNKLIDNLKEEELLGILFTEAAASAAHYHLNIEPIIFDRRKQRGIPIIGNENNE